MNDYGFDLVDSRLFHEVPNSMLEEFYEEKKPIGQKLKHKPKALEYSMLHRWFIFIKRNIAELEANSDISSEADMSENENENEKEEEQNPQQQKLQQQNPQQQTPQQQKPQQQKPQQHPEKIKQKGGEQFDSNLKIEELDLDKIII